MSDVIDLLWGSSVLQSNEHFTARLDGAGHQFEGVVVLPIDGEPGHIDYRLALDPGWRTREFEATVGRGAERTRLEIRADGSGRWHRDGAPLVELEGCLDIDLGWTPATNTLQIRRLGLAVGDRQTLDVAWLRFPELTLERVAQTYEHLGPTTWRYSAGGFSAVLEVDEHGFVRRYGDDLWLADAGSSR
jgi:hypothetical protein